MIEISEVCLENELGNSNIDGAEPRSGWLCGSACENGMACGIGCGSGVGGACGWGCHKG